MTHLTNFLFTSLSKFISLALVLTFPIATLSEVIPVEQIETGFLVNSTPTNTLFWRGINSKALLVLIPGGEGQLNLKPTTTNLRLNFFQTLKSLTNPELTSGQYDVVLFDSPYPMHNTTPRGAKDHLLRIESVIEYYHQKTNLPIWIMGHSNGGISISEFIAYLQQKNKTHQIAGVIASGIRNHSFFNPPIDFPILFIHHEKDACIHTSPSASFFNYQKVKEFTKSDVEYIAITSGEPEPRDPCRSGYHLYYNAGPELSKKLDTFLGQYYQ
jgi:hypothetical protein